MRVGGLCAGYGGLEMGLAQVLDCEPAWFCEFADGPSKILAHRYPGVPNHHDLTATDWATVEPVDIVTAGWPCQPWSNAGARKGADDERAIWPAIAGAIRTLRPRLVALENVSAVVAAGELARAVGDLAACGYDTQWVCVRASDVGAPHRRERIFILATDTERGGREWRSAQLERAPEHATGNGAGPAADATVWGGDAQPSTPARERHEPARGCGSNQVSADPTRGREGIVHADATEARPTEVLRDMRSRDVPQAVQWTFGGR